MPIILK